MNCTSSLELMLDAGPDELAGQGASALAVHVRECARCRAVADRLLADTQTLASVIGAREPTALPRARDGRIPRIVAGGGALVTTLAAAALVFAVLRHDSEPAKLVPSAPAIAIEPQRYADAVAVVPVPITPSRARTTALISADQPDLTVTPAPGVHAAVVHTSNPNITIVWLY